MSGIELSVGAERRGESRCAYCHGPLDGPVSRCASCGTECHTDCRGLLGGCPTLGCAESRPRGPGRPEPEPTATGRPRAVRPGSCDPALVAALARELERRTRGHQLWSPIAILAALVGLFVTFAYPIEVDSTSRSLSRYEPNWLGFVIFAVGAGVFLALLTRIRAVRRARGDLRALGEAPAHEQRLRVHLPDRGEGPVLEGELIDRRFGTQVLLDLGSCVDLPGRRLDRLGERTVGVRALSTRGPFLVEDEGGHVALVWPSRPS